MRPLPSLPAPPRPAASAKARVCSLQHPPGRGLAQGPMARRGQAGPSSSPGPGPHIPHPPFHIKPPGRPCCERAPSEHVLAWDSPGGCGTEGPNADGHGNTEGARG